MSGEDRIATQMQEVGRTPVIGESLAAIVRACNNIGLDPERVLVSGVVRVAKAAVGEPDVEAAAQALCAWPQVAADDREHGTATHMARDALAAAERAKERGA